VWEVRRFDESVRHGARVRELYILHDSADPSGSPAWRAVAQHEIMAESEFPCNCSKQPASRLA